MTTPREITAAALSLVGTPFHTQGRLPGIGIDCFGTLACVARICGMPFKDRIDYTMRSKGELRPELDRQFVRVQGEPLEGDILMMSLGGEPHHVAIMIDGGRFMHAHILVRRCVVQTYTDYWRSKVCAVYRFPGVA